MRGIKNIIALWVLFSQSVFAFTNYEELHDSIKNARTRVTALQEASRIADSNGFRIYLFGGAATSFARYVLWELEAIKKSAHLKNKSFDYSIDDIFTFTQDIDFAVEKIDGSEPSPFDLATFEDELRKALPERRIEVSSLHQSFISLEGRKRISLLTDEDFYKQHSDSLSFGLIDLNTSDFKLIDLKKRGQIKARFLEHLLEGKIDYLYSNKHSNTTRSKDGLNPEIISVIRYLIKVFRYDLKIPDKSLKKIKAVIDKFDPRDIKDGYVKGWIENNARKLFLEAHDLEIAWITLEDLGLRKKLIKTGNPEDMGSLAWLMSRKPLPSKPWISPAELKTKPKIAAELGISIVAHQTSRIEWQQSLTKNPYGKLNAFVSESRGGMNAKFGEGFYVSRGNKGTANTVHSSGKGRNVTLEVEPTAEEGIDFVRVYDKDFEKEHIVFLNSSKLTVLRTTPQSEAIKLVSKILDLTSLKHWNLAVGYLRKLRVLQLTADELQQIEFLITEIVPKSEASRKAHLSLILGNFKSDYEFIYASTFHHKNRAFYLPLIAANASLILEKRKDPHLQLTIFNALLEAGLEQKEVIKIITSHFNTAEEFFRLFEHIGKSFSDRTSWFLDLAYQFIALKNISINDIHNAETKFYGSINPFSLKSLAIDRGLVKSINDFLNLALLTKPAINGVETWRFGNGDLSADKLHEAFVNNASGKLHERYIAWITQNLDFILSLNPTASDIHFLARIIHNKEGKIALKKLFIERLPFNSAEELIDFLTPENNPPSDEYRDLTKAMIFNNISKILALGLASDDIKNILRIIYEEKSAQEMRQLILDSGAIHRPDQYLALFDYPFSNGEDSNIQEHRYKMIINNTENFLRTNPSLKEIHDYILLSYTYANKALIKERILKSRYLKTVSDIENLFSFEIVPPSKEFKAATKDVLLRNQDILLAINPDQNSWDNLMGSFNEKISPNARPAQPLEFSTIQIPTPVTPQPKKSLLRCLMRIVSFGKIK